MLYLEDRVRAVSDKCCRADVRDNSSHSKCRSDSAKDSLRNAAM